MNIAATLESMEPSTPRDPWDDDIVAGVDPRHLMREIKYASRMDDLGPFEAMCRKQMEALVALIPALSTPATPNRPSPMMEYMGYNETRIIMIAMVLSAPATFSQELKLTEQEIKNFQSVWSEVLGKLQRHPKAQSLANTDYGKLYQIVGKAAGIPMPPGLEEEEEQE